MKRIFVGLISSLILFSSCNNSSQPATLNVRLTDAPADYQEVLIDVQDVKIKAGNEWTSLRDVQTGVYNLLDFTNGLDTLLVSEQLPEGKISQMRLVLGENNQVKIDDVYYDLETPSAEQSGLKFNIHAELYEGVEYNLWIDFDAGRSIVEKGNGGYSLKPVIRTYTEATSGAIKGSVSPIGTKTYVSAITLDLKDTLSTYADTLSGMFLIKGVEDGVYNVTLTPEEPLVETIVEDVEVKIGEVSDIGEVVFE